MLWRDLAGVNTGMISSPRWRWGGSFFRASGESAFSCGKWGESKLQISERGLQYQFLAQLANAGPKSVKVNLTNCYREVCRIKFYQIATFDVLTSLWQFDKMLFWWLETCFYPLSTLLELQTKPGVFWNVKPSSIWFYWPSKKFFCCSSVL